MASTLFRHAALGLAAAAAALTAFPSLAQEWEPEKPIELVIMGGAGGGADRLARLFQSIMQKEGLTEMPVMPTNKGGGSGAEALRYMLDNSGNPHVIMATLNSYYTTPLRTDIGVDISQFTPLARMALDTFVLWVNPDSGITNLDEYVAAAKAGNGEFKMGGTGTGQEDSLVTAMIEGALGVEHTYVPFEGGGDVAKALAGGHVDATVNNPSEAMGFWKAGKMVPIASFTAERLEIMPDVPTMTELGHPLDYTMQRSFVAAPGVPAEAAAYYTKVFEQLHASQEWQDYAKEQALLTEFLTGADLQAYFLEERTKHSELLTSMGETVVN
jgi:tripartite-type tricarboxylate transporter receptor subunit TctC